MAGEVLSEPRRENPTMSESNASDVNYEALPLGMAMDETDVNLRATSARCRKRSWPNTCSTWTDDAVIAWDERISRRWNAVPDVQRTRRRHRGVPQGARRAHSLSLRQRPRLMRPSSSIRGKPTRAVAQYWQRSLWTSYVLCPLIGWPAAWQCWHDCDDRQVAMLLARAGVHVVAGQAGRRFLAAAGPRRARFPARAGRPD